MIIGTAKWVASVYAPNPLETSYWIDLTANEHGAVIKYYDGSKWSSIAATSDVDPDILTLYDEIRKLKDSKVDTEVYNLFVTESVAAHNAIINSKADKATTLSGYGITDSYTKTEIINKSTEIAKAEAAKLVDSAPEALNTLDELAAALGDDPNFATTISTNIGKKANSADVYTKEDCDTAIATAIDGANKVTSTDIHSIVVVTEIPTIQETGVLYIKIN